MIFKDHKEIEEKDIIEKYILSHLSEEEEMAFEEHLLYCQKCREEVRKSKEAIISIQHTETEKVMASGNGIMRFWTKINEGKLLFKIAAGIIVFAGASSIIYYLIRNEKSISEAREKHIVVTQTDSTNHISGKQERKVAIKPEDYIKANSDDDNAVSRDSKVLIAKAFSPNQTFETAIEDITRSEKVLVDIPKNTDKFKQSNKIAFKWRSEPPRNFILVIFNNTGKIIFEKTVKSPYKLKKTLIPGLYYWQLETEAEAVYTGKFIIEPN